MYFHCCRVYHSHMSASHTYFYFRISIIHNVECWRMRIDCEKVHSCEMYISGQLHTIILSAQS